MTGLGVPRSHNGEDGKLSPSEHRLPPNYSAKAKRKQARDPKTSAATLMRLAADDHHAVRAGVADNTSTPPEALAALANDHHPEVRWRVAINLNTPAPTVAALANDAQPQVRHWAALAQAPEMKLDFDLIRNNDTPASALIKMLRAVPDDQSQIYASIRKGILSHPNCPEHLTAIGALGS